MQMATMNSQYRSFLQHSSLMSSDKETPTYGGSLPMFPFFPNLLPPFSNSTSLPYVPIPHPSLFDSSEHVGMVNKKFPPESGLLSRGSSQINSGGTIFSPFTTLSNQMFMNNLTPSTPSFQGYKRFNPFDCQRLISAAIASRYPIPTIPKLIDNHSKTINDPFQKGKLIKMSDGEVKQVENLSIGDFEKSSATDGELKLVPCVVSLIETSHTECTARVQLVNSGKSFVIVIPVYKPFFTQLSGWSSVDPEACKTRYNLVASKLQLNDTCLCLLRKKKIYVNKKTDSSSPPRFSVEKSRRKTLRFQPY